MSAVEIFHLLGTYAEANILLIIGCLLFPLIRLPSQQKLYLGYLLAASAILIPLVLFFIPSQHYLKPQMQVWSGSNRAVTEGYAYVAPIKQNNQVPTSTLNGWHLYKKEALLLLCFLSAGIVFSFFSFVSRCLRLKNMLAGLVLYKKNGRVKVLVSEECGVPFSVWFFSEALVVLPVRTLESRRELALTIAHELQHHRQRDTVATYYQEAVCAVFFLNPFVRLWFSNMHELQEFACDEHLLGREHVSPQAYSRCLVETAKHAVGTWAFLSGTKAMASSSHGKLLKRRIEMILEQKSKKGREHSWIGKAISFGTLFVMASVAVATHGMVQDRRVTHQQAEAWRAKAQRNSEIPLAMNALVLRELNYFVGTPEGRQRFKNALVRMPMYKKMIDEKIEEYHFPKELIVVPLLESGFNNDAVSTLKSAGIWQFMAQTARRYGLRVDDVVDERLDENKETVAGLNYLKDLMREFHDWRLALKSYNEGEFHVEKLIKKYNTLDPWEIEMKEEGRDKYLATMTAGIIILQNLSSLD